VWNPEQYSRYSDERSRPFFDLTCRIATEDPRSVVDLGCGSGELTLSLAGRWPAADVTGIDSSPEMLAKASRRENARLRFVRGDIASWIPDAPVDVLVSNAALQWVPEHETLIPRLASLVAAGGTFAFQVPGNFAAPLHTLLADLRSSDRWVAKVGEGARRDLAVLEPEQYLALLAAAGFKVDAWETTYLHVLDGEDAVLEWVKGTALRPVLARLAPLEAEHFPSEYRALLREAYPRREFGTVLPFRRIFAVATRA
jgi:trans-aconitate 2-methyltransferase